MASNSKIQEQRLWETTKIWYTVSERSQNCYIRFPLRDAKGKRPMYIIYADTRQGLQIGFKEDESKNGPVNETSICHVRPGATMELFNQTISKSELEINYPRLAKTLYEATDTDPVDRMHLMINYWKSIGLVEKLESQYYATRGHTGYAKKPKDLQPRELEAENTKTERLRDEMNRKIAEYCAKYGKEALAAAEAQKAAAKAQKAAAEAKKAAATSSSNPAKPAPEQFKTAKKAAPAAPAARRPTASASSKPRLPDGSRAPIMPTPNSAAKHSNRDTSVQSGPASEPRLSASTGERPKSRRKGPFIDSSDEEDGTSGAPARQTPGGRNKDDRARPRSQDRSNRRPPRAHSQSSDSSGLFVRQSPSPPRAIPNDTSEWEPSDHEDAHSKLNKDKSKESVEEPDKAKRLMTAWSARFEQEGKAIAELRKQLEKDTSDLNKRKTDMKPRKFAEEELQLKKRNRAIADRDTEWQEARVSYEKAISDSREGTPVPEEKIVQQTLQSMRGETRKMTETPAPPKRSNRERSTTRHSAKSGGIPSSIENSSRKRRAESQSGKAKPKRPGVTGESTKVGSSSRRKRGDKEVISDESDHYIGNERVNERTGLREGRNWVEQSGPENPTYLELETMELERAQRKTLRKMIKAWEDKGSKGRKPTINDV